MRGDRAVVDNSATLRTLALHQPISRPSAQEHAGQIGGHDIIPELDVLGFQGNCAGVAARVVKQHVQPAEAFGDPGKQVSTEAASATSA